MSYFDKYLKYKNKYLKLKAQSAGSNRDSYEKERLYWEDQRKYQEELREYQEEQSGYKANEELMEAQIDAQIAEGSEDSEIAEGSEDGEIAEGSEDSEIAEDMTHEQLRASLMVDKNYNYLVANCVHIRSQLQSALDKTTEIVVKSNYIPTGLYFNFYNKSNISKSESDNNCSDELYNDKRNVPIAHLSLHPGGSHHPDRKRARSIHFKVANTQMYSGYDNYNLEYNESKHTFNIDFGSKPITTQIGIIRDCIEATLSNYLLKEKPEIGDLNTMMNDAKNK